MRAHSLPARLADAGVQVVAGDAHNITYRVNRRTTTAVLVIADHVSSIASVLNRVRRSPHDRVMIVCETITDQARAAALVPDSGIDLSVGATGELVLQGVEYAAPSAGARPRSAAQRRQRRRAAERVCVLAQNRLRQRDIAAAVGVSQQAISQMVDKAPLPETPMDPGPRRELLAAFAQIPADSGFVQTYWYGIDPVIQQANAAIGLGSELAVRMLSSGEVAADVLQPWRVPTHALLYSPELIDLSVVDLVAATEQEATLTLRVPADQTVWETAAWWQLSCPTPQDRCPTVDPVVVLQDLIAGADLADGAPERLTDWIAQR